MIDLHTHSTYSDGKLTPKQLVGYAHQCGIKQLALTDHDTVAGIPEALHYAKHYEIQLITGVEITANWHKHTVHIIGLQLDINQSALIHLLQRQALARETRAKLIGEKLAKIGLDDAYKNAKLIAQQGIIARPHFAQLLVMQGHAKDFKTAFKHYLVRGKIAYVETEWVTLADAIAVIHQSGGYAIIAHPLRYNFTARKLRELIATFKQCSGDGLEVISGQQNNNEINQLSTLCQAHDLLASVGSDFHGKGLTTIKMGSLAQLPTSCIPVWHNWR